MSKAHIDRIHAPLTAREADTSTCDSHLRPAKRRKEEAFHTRRGKEKEFQEQEAKKQARARHALGARICRDFGLLRCPVSLSHIPFDRVCARTPRHSLGTASHRITPLGLKTRSNTPKTRYFIALIYSFWLEGPPTTSTQTLIACAVLCCAVLYSLCCAALCCVVFRV